MKRLCLGLLVLSAASCASPRGQSHEHWNAGAQLHRSVNYHFFSYNSDMETWGPGEPWFVSLGRHVGNYNADNPFKDATLDLHPGKRGKSTQTGLTRPADFVVGE